MLLNWKFHWIQKHSKFCPLKLFLLLIHYLTLVMLNQYIYASMYIAGFRVHLIKIKFTFCEPNNETPNVFGSILLSFSMVKWLLGHMTTRITWQKLEKDGFWKYIDSLICKLANYIFINAKTYLSAQWSNFDDLDVKIIRGASEFDLYG